MVSWSWMNWARLGHMTIVPTFVVGQIRKTKRTGIGVYINCNFMGIFTLSMDLSFSQLQGDKHKINSNLHI